MHERRVGVILGAQPSGPCIYRFARLGRFPRAVADMENNQRVVGRRVENLIRVVAKRDDADSRPFL